MHENIFRANDIRGIYGKEFDDDFVYKTGRAIIKFLKCKKIIIGRDMRLSSIALFNAISKGITESGCDVIDIGLIDTPALYFASGFYKMPGIMITASHNPAEYNGIKIVKAGAGAVDFKNGLNEIKNIIENENFINAGKNGKISKMNIFEKYKKHILSFIKPLNFDGIKIVIDAGNGMAGKIAPLIYGDLIKIIPLYFKLDGRFPNHVPNPIIKRNLIDLKNRVREEKADFGIAFDGDMDRVAFVDEKGNFANTSFIGALLIKYLLRESRKYWIIYTSACSRIVPETISKFKGRALREKVGHAFIKGRMRKENAFFGIEHSGHYYFRDNYYADSALITSLLIIKIYSLAKKQGMKFSDLLKEFNKYFQADEVSIKLRDDVNIVERIEKYYRVKRPMKIDHFDGLTIKFNDYWFSVRKSNTEPLLRINLEALDKEIMKERLKEILRIVKR